MPILMLGICVLGTFGAMLLFLIFSPSGNNPRIVLKSPVFPTIKQTESAESKISKVDFQEVVDNWIRGVAGNKSVLIYDLDRDEIVGEYESHKLYQTASLYKLFVVYEGYRRVESGSWVGGAIAGYTGRTILECLDLAIRESNSLCAETLWGMIGRATLDEIIRDDFGITESNISSLSANADDILKIMQKFYRHPDVTDEILINRMKDSFLNQPITAYDWRGGLPSGFKIAEVYNKVGWEYNPSKGYWDIYHDAAIVKFPEIERSFIVVVMTNYVANQKIAELGSKIEQLVLNEY